MKDSTFEILQIVILTIAFAGSYFAFSIKTNEIGYYGFLAITSLILMVMVGMGVYYRKLSELIKSCQKN